MDYGKLFSKAWDIVWEHKYLILLGVLVALGSAGGSGAGQGGASGMNDQSPPGMPPFDFNLQEPFRNLGVPLFALVGGLILLGVVLVVGLALWVISTISRGGLIHGADTLAGGGVSSFSTSFRAGWKKGWRLVGIGLFPAVPGFLLVLIGLFSFGLYRRVEIWGGDAISSTVPAMLGFIPNIALVCVLLLTMLLLSLLRSFANRACMLEDQGVFDSYRRGFEVLFDNLGAAIVLFLLQVAVTIGVVLALLIPGIFILVCCFLWPILLLVQGTFEAFFSTLWTLAWNQWTGRMEVVEAEPADAGQA